MEYVDPSVRDNRLPLPNCSKHYGYDKSNKAHWVGYISHQTGAVIDPDYFTENKELIPAEELEQIKSNPNIWRNLSTAAKQRLK